MTTRRNFLLGLAGLTVIPKESSATAVTVTRPGTAFGTTVSLTVTAPTHNVANSAIDDGFAVIRDIHKAASLFDPESEISRLNRTSRLDRPSAHFTALVALSDRLHNITAAAFDPTVQSLWALWTSGGGPPSQSEKTEALRRVAWHHLVQFPQQLHLMNQATLTFNGIAQGYAADQVVKVLKAKGVQQAAIDTGEQAMMDARGRFAIKHPRGDKPLGWVSLRDGFIAVSGDYSTSFTPDFLHHHIFDPARGTSPRELACCVVIAPTGAEADGLATAFMVLGVKSSLYCISRLQGVTALFVRKDGSMVQAPGFAPYFQNT